MEAPATPNGTVHTGRKACLLLLAFALWTGLLGLAPHLYFSLKAGELSFFQYAFDEPHYYFLSTDPAGAFWIKRSNIVLGLSKLLHGDAALVMMAMDFLIPMLAAMAALLLSSQLFKSVPARVLGAIFVLFGQELLSGGCMSIYPGLFNSFYFYLSETLRQFVPYFGSSFYSLYRTPEPQVGYILMFAMTAHLLHVFFRKDGRITPLDWAIQLAGNALVGLNYIFCAVPFGIFEAGLCLYFLLRRRLHPFLLFTGGGLFLAASVVYVYFWAGKDLGDSYGGFVFHSRLPSLSSSQLFALLTGGLAIWLFRRKLMSADELAASASALAIPFILMNQQVLTGLMISARDWEKYSIYPFLAIAFMLCARALRPLFEKGMSSLDRLLSIPGMKSPNVWAAALSLGLILLLTHGQRSTYRMWAWYNEMSHSYALAIRQSIEEGASQPSLCVEHLMMEPLINMRFSRKLPFIIYFDDTTFHPIALLPPGGGDLLPEGSGYFKDRLFEYFARRGMRPEELLTLLKGEIDNCAGFFLGFAFAPMDYTFVASDFRLYRKAEISKLIPSLVAEYGRHLEEFGSKGEGASILLTAKKPGEVSAPKGMRNDLVPWQGPPSFHTIDIYKQRAIAPASAAPSSANQ